MKEDDKYMNDRDFADDAFIAGGKGQFNPGKGAEGVNDDKFLKSIYDSQSSFELDEPEGLWEAIESSLNEDAVAAAADADSETGRLANRRSSSRRRRIISVVGGLSVAAAVALFYFAGGMHGNNEDISVSPISTSQKDILAELHNTPASDGISVNNAGASKSYASNVAGQNADDSNVAHQDAAVLNAGSQSSVQSVVSGTDGKDAAAQVAPKSSAEGFVSNTDSEDAAVPVAPKSYSKQSAPVAVKSVEVGPESGDSVMSNENGTAAPKSINETADSKSENEAADSRRYKRQTNNSDLYSSRQNEVKSSGQYDSPRRDKSGFTISANASSVGGIRTVSNGYAALSNSDVTRQVSEFGAMGNEYSQVLLSNNNNEVSSLTKHYQPIRFGVTAAYRFNHVISVESGLSYTCLVSNLSSGSDKGKYTTRQQLHYIGIPLNLRLEMWSIRNFSIYFSGGGMMEKCIAGKSVTRYAINGLKDSSASSSLSEKQLQWSVNGAFGAQYRFNELVGLYVEPGVSYYFNNGSSIENIYKERPLNFNIALGLRFNIP